MPREIYTDFFQEQSNGNSYLVDQARLALE
jgi:hypothetical protein